ncbi:MAG: hypothetical protein EBT26_11755, partial [Microbacteriaceae bacterium]|nr:hypothetical protein [Microbacteriaceae bacterium]
MLLPAGTDAVAVTAIPSDSSANVEITGNADLKIGDNTLSVVVTAEDGTATTYSVTLKVLASDDTSLAVFQYDGSDVADGDVFDLDYGTTSVAIDAQPTTNLSKVEIIGADALTTGKNTVRIKVTAEDESVKTYYLFFNVAPNTDTSVESVTVAGQDATGGDVTVPAGTRAVAVSAVTTDPFATYVVDGNTDLQPGENTVTITVTAADGETTKDYTVTVNIPVLSDDASTSLFQINGKDVNDGDSLDLPYGTRKVNYKVEVTDAGATYSVSGDGSATPLVAGSQDFVLTVTAANGD